MSCSKPKIRRDIKAALIGRDPDRWGPAELAAWMKQMNLASYSVAAAELGFSYKQFKRMVDGKSPVHRTVALACQRLLGAGTGQKVP